MSVCLLLLDVFLFVFCLFCFFLLLFLLFFVCFVWDFYGEGDNGDLCAVFFFLFSVLE